MNYNIIIIIIVAIEFSPGGSSHYTSTEKTNKNKIHVNETIQKHRTNNTEHSKYRYSHFPTRSRDRMVCLRRRSLVSVQ